MVVSKTDSSISTVPSNRDGAPVGTSIKDTAAVEGNDPTGTVTFYLYGPNDPNCVNNADSGLHWLQKWTVELGDNGKASVPAPGFATTVSGTYEWVAHYNGDANNATVTSPCGSEACTAAASTFSGRCTPIVTSTCMRRESSPKLRIRLSEL